MLAFRVRGWVLFQSIDASTTVAWLFKEVKFSQLLPDDFGRDSLVAPWLWRLEVTNVLMNKERRRLVPQEDVIRFLQIVDALEVDIIGERPHRSLVAVALFAQPHQLTSYDARYLETAIDFGLPLCTFDRNLQRAARRSGVPLIIDFEHDRNRSS